MLVETLRLISPDIITSISFVVFRHIHETMMNILFNAPKKFNIGWISQMDRDYYVLFNFCSEKLKDVQGLKDMFRELRQLIDLFLIGPMLDLADPEKRKKTYDSLDGRKVLGFLERYDVNSVMFLII